VQNNLLLFNYLFFDLLIFVIGCSQLNAINASKHLIDQGEEILLIDQLKNASKHL